MMKMILVTCVLGFSFSAMAAIPEKEVTNFAAQYQVAANPALAMTQRWKALLKAAELAEGREMEKILAFAESKDWYMRNATLVALDKLGNDMVYEKAKVLVSDKALVVRSAAVDVLSRLNNREIRKIFSQELAKPYNFSGKTSLWIRAQIMKHLIQSPTEEERPFFAHYLFDRDRQIAEMSTLALEKVTNIKFQGSDRLAQWKKIAKDRRWF